MGSTPVFTAIAFTAAKVEAAQLATDRRVNETRLIHTMQHCSALERKDGLTQATMWMNHEDMLSKTSQSQKDRYCMIPFMQGP